VSKYNLKSRIWLFNAFGFGTKKESKRDNVDALYEGWN